MQSEVLTALVFNALEEMKGLDITAMDVRPLTTVTDTMIVCTGTSNRHVKSLADNVVQHAKQHGINPIGVEGKSDGEWILIDLSHVIVHLMLQRIRDFYSLEKLWQVPVNKASN